MASDIYLAEDGQQVGPLDEDTVRRMIAEGRAQEGTYAWIEGAPDWRPLGELLPELFAMTIAVSRQALAQSGASTTQMAAGAPDMAALGRQAQPAQDKPPATTFEVIVADLYRLPKITLDDDSVVVESGALHYMVGNITLDAQGPSVGGSLKATLTQAKAVRPVYRGTGTIFLEPTFGECTVLELAGDEWILDRGAFLACDRTVVLDLFTNKAWAGLVGGEGLFQTRVSGKGKVLVRSPGPIERLSLTNETLVVNGTFAVARTAGIDYRIERASKELFSSWASGEGLLSTFRGQGAVLIAPVPNRFTTLLGQFAALQAALNTVKK